MNNHNKKNLSIEDAEDEITKGNLDSAIRILNNLLFENESSVPVLNDLAVVHILSEDYEEAISVLNRIIFLEPENEIALGNIQFLLGNGLIETVDNPEQVKTITTNENKLAEVSKWDSAVYYHLFSGDSMKNRKFYNIGAGSFSHPYWTNIDFYSKWYGPLIEGIHYNLMDLKPLPIENNSAEIFYTSHTIEHVTDEAVENVFAEVYRILKKGGLFRITAPDSDIHYKIFKEKNYNFHYDRAYYSTPEEMNTVKINKPMLNATIGEIFLHFIATSLSPMSSVLSKRKFTDEELEKLFSEMEFENALNYICSFCEFDANNAGFHINWWNTKKVIEFLKKAGFSEMYISSCGQSKSPVMWDLHKFDNTRPTSSFYVEALK